MSSTETLSIKVSVNELSSPLVTHPSYFDTRFSSNRLLKSGYSADQILDRLGIQGTNQVLGPQEAQNLQGFEHSF
jgi:hypothetical protein